MRPEQYPIRWGDLVVSHLVAPAALVLAAAAANAADMIPEPVPDGASTLTLDIISSIQERYPLLRNRL